MKRLIVIILMSTAFISGGCGPSKRLPKKIEIKKPEAVPGSVTGTGWKMRWRHELRGKSQPLLYADSATGALTNKKGVTSTEMRQVHGRLFHEAIESAQFSADKLVGDEKSKVMVAYGHAHIKSLNPADKSVSADRISMNMKTNAIVADGNVFYSKRLEDGTLQNTKCKRVRTDTKLKDVYAE